MNRDQRNPLRDGAGKGDAPKNCHNPKFRKNWDGIQWNKGGHDWMDGLTVKAVHVLYHYNLTKKIDVIIKIKNGTLNPCLHKFKFFGKKPYREICKHLKLKSLF